MNLQHSYNLHVYKTVIAHQTRLHKFISNQISTTEKKQHTPFLIRVHERGISVPAAFPENFLITEDASLTHFQISCGTRRHMRFTQSSNEHLNAQPSKRYM